VTVDQAELAAAFAEAQTKWPGVDLSLAQFVQACERQAPQAPHLSEFYLAQACIGGSAAAHQHFERDFLASTLGPVRRVVRDDAQVEELLQLTRVRLLVGEGRPRLAEYKGHGSLQGWVKAVAIRLALNHLTTRNRTEAREAPVEALTEASLEQDPTLAMLQQTHRDDFRAALQAAWQQLTERQRTVLRMNTLERASIDRIGAVYGVHRVTASRWVERARGELLAGTRDVLAARLKLSTNELESLLRAVDSKLEISLRSIMGS
jgi:RNA polymerase sigma-70 factor, ECF subfamily